MSGSGGPVPRDILAALDAVESPDPGWAERAAEHQSRLTMPPGSLGRLVELGRQLAAVQRSVRPTADPALVAVFAADHGVAAAGVSAYPQAVTGQMVANYLRGGAAVNVLARRVGAELRVVDLGVAHPGPLSGMKSRLISRPVGPGTLNFQEGPAMARSDAFKAFRVGLELGDDWVGREGFRVIALGEMGIGNTTSAAALIAALTHTTAEAVVGPGTGVDPRTLTYKREVVDSSVRRHLHDAKDAWDIFARLGGFEIIGLAGLAVAAARGRSLVLLDGLISTAAGLLAASVCPAVVGSLVAAHLGPEPGHRVALVAMGLRPLLELNLRLGEGTGAALALPLIASSADILREMSTFEDAGVSRGGEPALPTI